MTRVMTIHERLAEVARTQRPLRDEWALPCPAERKSIRIRAGFTQAEVARALSVHPETFGRWERGDGRPGDKALVEYAQALEFLRER
jgi:DNA-binding XRE family transcriptional regulator